MIRHSFIFLFLFLFLYAFGSTYSYADEGPLYFLQHSVTSQKLAVPIPQDTFLPNSSYLNQKVPTKESLTAPTNTIQTSSDKPREILFTPPPEFVQPTVSHNIYTYGLTREVTTNLLFSALVLFSIGTVLLTSEQWIRSLTRIFRWIFPPTPSYGQSHFISL